MAAVHFVLPTPSHLLCLSVSSSSSVFHSRYVSVSTLFLSLSLCFSLSPSFLSVAKFSTPAEETRVETRVETRMETWVETSMRRDIFREKKSVIGDFPFFFIILPIHVPSFFHPRKILYVRLSANRNESEILRRFSILFKQIIWISRDPPRILDILGRNFYSNYDYYYSNDFSYFQSFSRKKSTEIKKSWSTNVHFSPKLIYNYSISPTSNNTRNNFNIADRKATPEIITIILQEFHCPRHPE